MPTDVPTFPLVMGCRRSGLTLLRAMCASHPQLAVPPEASFTVEALPTPNPWAAPTPFDPTQFIERIYATDDLSRWRLPRAEVDVSFRSNPPTSYADAVRRVYRLWAEREGKDRYLDVTPGNTAHVDALATLFPEARIVHLVRDGRDVGASLLELGWVDSMHDAALHWRHIVQSTRRSLKRLPPNRYHEMRYEDLIEDPEGTLRSMCEAIDLPFDAAMLDHRPKALAILRSSPNPHHHRYLAHPLMPNLRDWRRDLPPQATERFGALARETLTEFGYERGPTGLPWRSRIAANARRAGWRRRVRDAA